MGNNSLSEFYDRFDEKNAGMGSRHALSQICMATPANGPCPNPEEVFENLLELAMKTLNSDIASILLRESGRAICRIHNLTGTGAASLIPLHSPASISMKQFRRPKPGPIQGSDRSTGQPLPSRFLERRKDIICIPIVVRNEIMGTIFVGNRLDNLPYTPRDMELLATIASQTGLVIENARLNDEHRTLCMNVVKPLVSAIDANDRYTSGHSERVACYSIELAEKAGLPPDRVKMLERAALLHDIGKIGIPASLLNKNTPLTAEEICMIRRHPLTGVKILEPFEFFRAVRLCIGQHHERVDGQGYPHGLAGEELMVEARILAIADAFDAMTSDRPYRRALSCREAIDELLANAGKQHDRNLVRLFVELATAGRFIVPRQPEDSTRLSCPP